MLSLSLGLDFIVHGRCESIHDKTLFVRIMILNLLPWDIIDMDHNIRGGYDSGGWGRGE